MNKYETLFILNPSLDEEGINTNVEKFKSVITNGGGEVENVDLWGKRKLAYEIDKVNEGIYVLVNFQSDAQLPKELDRVFRISDSIIRHLIISLEK
ncbi:MULTISPECIES: 30S ribosomal protein S6 [Clostridium]|uniref:Small ribosomal subunit protein bS6 n=1 Tax=Clostridium acetobutylicum (strain ATCC 824 / DSM 792 / JCM 1419 / IAM 19013 / LMG 5710 / NBRC 13948 / NRRL B-527 / VKM B-1787 / 2291 / W) TaxID=272562 RepID=RS6_CLOAB|nr:MULTISPECIES: 30S ribosomal protein S6 [Clostridium]Q97CX2.1 RecName: Full=Small ribosomal subunit protein bS6; AltName: Full=30S ribosomal protein S6 [Clostridium acetobutylicum ATCC 824]AAK81644.1 Ribosomal protein S6 [Clostridium acetobutylicum ATCC 824]ADZ22768.1 30S ribosomal protein S6 [Clostridium acetobutylicum EA 2018]AEI34048.1 30S ribosomal protein S6 [Clostridium acetobutylicum DSM 1731]AWV82231.1 30S ribosomal protein S6 [Clostridium acetobutylicum]KHD34524.1 30S ribosomal pro